MAIKYEMDSLRAFLIKFVAGDWPLTLFQWDAMIAERNSFLLTPEDERPEGLPYLADRVLEPASAIVFAREFGCTEILPAALYLLLMTPILCEWEPHDSTNVSLICDATLARWDLLDAQTLLGLHRGLDALEEYILELCQRTGCAVHYTSSGGAACPYHGEMRHLMQPRLGGSQIDCLRVLKKWRLDGLNAGTCECNVGEWGVAWAEREREKLWSELPRLLVSTGLRLSD